MLEKPQLFRFHADLNERGISTAKLPHEIAALADRNLVVLQGAFSEEMCLELRKSLRQWVSKTPQNAAQGQNWHYLVSRPDDQGIPTQFRNHLFCDLDHMVEKTLQLQLQQFFVPLHRLFCDLHQIPSQSLHDNIDGCRFHPLIFHYPRGSGNFARYAHSDTHQRYQIVVNLSRPGVDFGQGGVTTFEIEGQELSLEGVHNCGDIVIFPYHVPHWITAVDPEFDCDWHLDSGRYSLLLPYHPPESLRKKPTADESQAVA